MTTPLHTLLDACCSAQRTLRQDLSLPSSTVVAFINSAGDDICIIAEAREEHNRRLHKSYSDTWHRDKHIRGQIHELPDLLHQLHAFIDTIPNIQRRALENIVRSLNAAAAAASDASLSAGDHWHIFSLELLDQAERLSKRGLPSPEAREET